MIVVLFWCVERSFLLNICINMPSSGELNLNICRTTVYYIHEKQKLAQSGYM